MDVQLKSPIHPNEYIFIEEAPSKRTLDFKFKHVRWNPNTETNRPLSTRVVIAENFSSEWITLMNAGWKRVD